jgi:hypothetical protein
MDWRMAQQGGSAAPEDSADDRWRWDGRQWVLAGQVRARRRRRWPWLVAAGLVVVVAAAAVLVTQLQAAPDAGSLSPSDACSPQPCANDGDGWIVTVSDLSYGAQSGNRYEAPAAGSVYVTMSITFTNQTSGPRRAIPGSFVLLDGAGVRHPVISIGTCQLWEPLDVAAGATLGPRCLAFEATAGRPTGLDLTWTPTPGGDDQEIELH